MLYNIIFSSNFRKKNVIKVIKNFSNCVKVQSKNLALVSPANGVLIYVDKILINYGPLNKLDSCQLFPL